MVHHRGDHHSRPFPSKSPPLPPSPPRISQGFSSPAVVVVTGAPIPQPFDIASPIHSPILKSPGGLGLGAATMAAAAKVTTSLGYPFTHAQWKELETQAMIYKYMVASLPVPLDLLIPIIRSVSHQSAHYSPYSFGSGLALGYGSRTDGEPGRCKRTDGKKWRCSREVAPHQKYCDRHLHRGRPRSRKLVEVQATNGSSSTGAAIFGNNRAKKTRSHGGAGLPSYATVSFSGGGGAALARRDDRVPMIFPGNDDNSSFLTLETSFKETRDGNWLMIGDNPSSASAYNSFPASSYLGSTDYDKGQGHGSFFNSNPPALSSLTLSMGGTNDGEMGSGLRSVDSGSWVALASGGGPLAEALSHRITSTPSNPSSPNIAGSRTLASLSDSSSAGSPRLAASPFTRSEFTVQWFAPPNNLASFTN